MVKNGIYVVRQDTTVKGNFKLIKNQEIGVSNNIIYMGGFPLDSRLQQLMMTWMKNNMNLLIVDNRF